MTALTSGKYRSIVPPFECSSSAPPRFMTLDMESANSLRARKPAALSVDERIVVKINAHDSTRYDSANLLGLNTANFGMSPTMVLLMMETLTSCKRKMVRATSLYRLNMNSPVCPSNSPKTNSEPHLFNRCVLFQSCATLLVQRVVPLHAISRFSTLGDQ